jgi:5-methylcytosine-specific restriction endonuclease McrA
MPYRVPTHRPPHLGSPLDARRAAGRHYSRYRRDKDRQAFYQSAAWRGVRDLRLSLNPYCAPCLARGDYTPATFVHHKVPIEVDPSLALDLDNTESQCRSCHSRLHARDTDKI